MAAVAGAAVAQAAAQAVEGVSLVALMVEPTVARMAAASAVAATVAVVTSAAAMVEATAATMAAAARVAAGSAAGSAEAGLAEGETAAGGWERPQFEPGSPLPRSPQSRPARQRAGRLPL